METDGGGLREIILGPMTSASRHRSGVIMDVKATVVDLNIPHFRTSPGNAIDVIEYLIMVE